MNLFELSAKISVDDSNFKKSMENAQKVSKNVANAMKELQSPLDKAKSGFNAIAHPIETAKANFEKLKNATEAMRHPIETFKNKVADASTALETKRNKLSTLAAGYDSAKKKVADITKEFNKSAKESGTSSKKTQELAKKLNEAEKEAEEAKKELDDYSASVSKAGKSSDSASKGVGNFASKLGKGLATAAKIGTAAVGAAAAGITALTTAAVNNYAEYEQLVGGVQTLFGLQGQSLEEYAATVGKTTDEALAEWLKYTTGERKILNNAEIAYKTAGLSMNRYMETVTSFSASLIASLGGDTAKAADYADQAIIDMSDNANKMGTDISLIQNAYQGFAKQNYTMLDNLKLGYGGTQAEMIRLLQDADALSESFNLVEDENGDLVYSFADIVDAIHIVQDNMGITGATALEAGTTIEGSVNSMKAAWSDFLTSLADENADYQYQLDNLLESVKTVATNVYPVVEQTLWSIADMVEDVLPEIAAKIPEIISEVLPRVTKIAVKLVESLMNGISKNQEMLFTSIFDVVTYLADSFIGMLPEIAKLGLDLIVSLANGIAKSLPELIPTIIDVVLQIVDTLTDPNTLSSLVNASISIIVAIANGLIASLPELIAKAPVIVGNLVTAIVQNAPQLLQAAYQIVTQLLGGIVQSLPELGTAAGSIVGQIVSGISSLWSSITSVGSNIVSGVWQGIQNGYWTFYYNVRSFFSNIVSSVKYFLGIRSPSRVFRDQIGKQMAAGVSVGWNDEFSKVKKDIDNSLNFADATIGINASVKKNGIGENEMQYGNGFGGVTVVQNIYSEAKTAADLMQDALYQQERAVLLGV